MDVGASRVQTPSWPLAGAGDTLITGSTLLYMRATGWPPAAGVGGSGNVSGQQRRSQPASLDAVQRAFLERVLASAGRPLWPHEDLQPARAPLLQLTSARALAETIECVLHVLRECAKVPPPACEAMAELQERLALFALHQALSCSSRHLACRSFQIFRALNVAITSQVLNDILTRLIETVAEQNDELQVSSHERSVHKYTVYYSLSTLIRVYIKEYTTYVIAYSRASQTLFGKCH